MKVRKGKNKLGRFISISQIHGERKEECKAVGNAILKWLDEEKVKK